MTILCITFWLALEVGRFPVRANRILPFGPFLWETMERKGIVNITSSKAKNVINMFTLVFDFVFKFSPFHHSIGKPHVQVFRLRFGIASNTFAWRNWKIESSNGDDHSCKWLRTSRCWLAIGFCAGVSVVHFISHRFRGCCSQSNSNRRITNQMTFQLLRFAWIWTPNARRTMRRLVWQQRTPGGSRMASNASAFASNSNENWWNRVELNQKYLFFNLITNICSF